MAEITRQDLVDFFADPGKRRDVFRRLTDAQKASLPNFDPSGVVNIISAEAGINPAAWSLVSCPSLNDPAGGTSGMMGTCAMGTGGCCNLAVEN